MFKTGAILAPLDDRDFTIQPLSAIQIPDTWTRTKLPEIGDQLVNNCTAWGSGYAYEANTGIKFSKDYAYGEREPTHWMGEGRRMDELMHTLLHYGNVEFPVDPYEREMTDAYDFVQACKDTLRPKAEKYKIKAYARMFTEVDIKTAMMNGMEVIAGIPLDEWNPDAEGVWHCVEGLLGHHCIWVCDWSKDYPALFKCGNSWGTDWGKNGYFYISAQDLLAKQNVWALQFEKKKDEPINPVIRRTLRLKSPMMRGDDVKEAQTKLTAHGYPCGKIDGIFGKYTDIAVKNFQYANKLKMDGIIGPKTWAVLDKLPTPPDNKISRFISWLKSQVGMIYVWGAQGQIANESWIVDKETSVKNANRALALYRKRKAEGVSPIYAYDCSGLIVYWLLKQGLIKSDRSSRGLYSDCVKIKREELKPGDLVFRHNGLRIHHVGIYIGDGLVIEAKGRDDGVVLRDINAAGSSYWNRYGRLGVLQDG